MKPFWVQLLVFLFMILMMCGSPFFPATGIPAERPVDVMRATPEGLLDLLIESYESKDLALYKELFPEDGTFQFFVTPSYVDEERKLKSEDRDSRLYFLGAWDHYYYWSQSVEIDKHTKLFSRLATIEFITKPVIGSVRKFISENDSCAELQVLGGELEVTRFNGPVIEVYRADIGEQVMFAKKGSDNLWVLQKWYDFSGAD